MFDTLDFEHTIIGAICVDQSQIRNISTILRPDDFSIKACSLVYQLAVDLDNQGKLFDGYIAAEFLKGKIQEPRKFLAECIECVTTTANTEEYARQLRKTSDNNKLRLRVMDAFIGDDPEIVETVAAICSDIIQHRPSTRVKTIEQAAGEAYNALFELESKRIDTGFGKLDGILKGFHSGELVIIGARPAVGKSAFALALAEYAAKHRVKVVIHSLEMEDDEISERMFVRHTRKTALDNLIDRNLTNEQGEDVAEAYCTVAEYPILIDDSPMQTVSKIRSQALSTPDLGLIIVDYLQLLQPDHRAEKREVEVSEMSRGLKALAMELKIPVIAMSQLNRIRGDDEKPTLRELRESGSLEQDANKVLLLWNIDKEHNIVGCNVAKSRRGKTGVVQFVFDGSHMTFCELAEEYVEPEGKRKNGFLEI